MRAHLHECDAYKQKVREARERQGLPPLRQATLTNVAAKRPVVPLTTEAHESLLKKAGYVVYVGARPFSLWEDYAMGDFLDELNPAFKPPGRKLVGGRLLTTCYNETFKGVLEAIKLSDFINISTDESSTSMKDRVINYSIVTSTGKSFCMKLEEVPTGTSSAERQADWLNRAIDILETGFQKEYGQHAKLPRLNSVATDTCSTMRCLWRILSTKPRFKSSFFVPCDSHGLQLLIKDIISLPLFVDTMTLCNHIVGHFRSAHKQLALVRSLQKEIYGRKYALTLAGNTRWGTQYLELFSLKRSREALRQFRRTKDNDCKDQAVLDAITDAGFWEDVDELLDILKPIHNHQIMSESSRGHLGQVRTRWLQIREDLEAHDHYDDLLDAFDKRIVEQLSEIHTTAYFLDPANTEVKFKGDELDQVFKVFKAHSSENFNTMRSEFLDFRKKRRNFDATTLWDQDLIKDPEQFWEIAGAKSPTLAEFAERLFSTPPNSVPSERAFSAMNLQQTNLRMNLTMEKLDLLTFIHMNYRALHPKKLPYKTKIYTLNEDEELELEDKMLAMEAQTDQASEDENRETERPRKRQRMS
jgi:Protein of unknown function (DUF 659)/hAT family C-terminal dimerisation region